MESWLFNQNDYFDTDQDSEEIYEEECYRKFEQEQSKKEKNIMIKINTKVGNQIMQLEFEKMSQVHKFNKIYAKLPKVCDNCKSENIFVSYMNPGGNDYWTIECGDCTASANFGIHKDGTGLFWKGDKMTVYQGQDTSGDGEFATNPNGSRLPSNEKYGQPEADLPF